MYYLNPTKKFLLFSVSHGGAGFSSYPAGSGHFYYKNNLDDPWGNNGVHIGSFNLKTAGTSSFVIGDATDAQGTILQGLQKYTPICNLFTAGAADYHFITIVIDRPKPSEYGATSCPNPTAPHDFLDGYDHPAVTVTLTPYYKDASNNLIAGSNISTSYWEGRDFAGTTTLGSACYSIAANTRTSASYPDDANLYLDGTPPQKPAAVANYWVAGNQAMPRHGCRAFPPGTSTENIPPVTYYFYNINTSLSPRCVASALYTYRGAHYWLTTFTNPYGTNGAVNSCKVTVTSQRHTNNPAHILSQNYYNTLDPYVNLIGGGAGSGIHQCNYAGTGRYSPNSIDGPWALQAQVHYYGFPRYMPELAPRCNMGSRTSTFDPYYSAGGGAYGGYGFYMRFNWDAFCYPCA